MNGRPLDLEGTRAGSIPEIWYPGSEDGRAAANLLVGDAAPGGKLPFTWLRTAAQAPLIRSRLNSHDPANADRRYWNESNKPIGYGLS